MIWLWRIWLSIGLWLEFPSEIWTSFRNWLGRPMIWWIKILRIWFGFFPTSDHAGQIIFNLPFYQRASRALGWSWTDRKYLAVQVADKFISWFIKTPSKPGHICINGPWSQIFSQIWLQWPYKRKKWAQAAKTFCWCRFSKKGFGRCRFLAKI